MITLSAVYNFLLDKFGARILKIDQYGPKTAVQCGPPGDDSCPTQGMDAIYATTDNDDEPVVIGFINYGQMAAAGEKRLYSKSADGKQISFSVWWRNNGTIEIGGHTDNAVRYTPLNQAEQQSVQLINAELTKIQAAIASLGGAYARAPVTIDISAAKINEIKTL